MPSHSYAKSSAFTKLPLKFDQIPLGTLVHDLNDPNIETWTPPKTIDPAVFAAIKNDHQASTNTIGRSSGTSFGAKFTKFFGFDHTNERSRGLNIDAEEGFEYMLEKPTAAFEAICADPTARSWIKDAVENPSCQDDGVYLVIGLRTFVNSNLGVESGQSSSTAIQAEAPVGEALGVPAGGDALDSSLTAEHRTEISLAEQMALPGERIYEIYYRKLKFNFWKPKDNPKLGKKCWQLVTSNLGGGDEEDDDDDEDEDEDDILEVDLEDEVV